MRVVNGPFPPGRGPPWAKGKGGYSRRQGGVNITDNTPRPSGPQGLQSFGGGFTKQLPVSSCSFCPRPRPSLCTCPPAAMSETASNSDKLMTHSYDGPKITELKGQPVRPPTPRPPPPAPRRARWPWRPVQGGTSRVASYPELEGLPGAARGCQGPRPDRHSPQGAGGPRAPPPPVLPRGPLGPGGAQVPQGGGRTWEVKSSRRADDAVSPLALHTRPLTGRQPRDRNNAAAEVLHGLGRAGLGQDDEDLLRARVEVVGVVSTCGRTDWDPAPPPIAAPGGAED